MKAIKKRVQILLASLVALSSYGQEKGVLTPRAAEGWSAGFGVGVSSPLKGHSFWGNMRPTVSVDVEKALLPSFSLGTEYTLGFNSSRWPGLTSSPTGVDHSYWGVYGHYHVSAGSCWQVGLAAGCGWGHSFNHAPIADHNFFATKVGCIFRYRINPSGDHPVDLRLAPSVMWDMTDVNITGTTAGYNVRGAVFMLQAGVRFNFGRAFDCVRLYDGAEVDALNNQVNVLRADLAEARSAVVREEAVDNRLNTVVDVFFHVGSTTVTADQMPNVERIAVYLKNHPEYKVVIKGYASAEGGAEINNRLSEGRAQAVSKLLTEKYHISRSRVEATGAGIGELFEEAAWNRVCVCTLTDVK